MNIEEIGEIINNKTLLFRSSVGEAKDTETGDIFLMAHSMNGSPLIEHKQTGNKFSLPWKDIIDLAKIRGITKKEEI